MEWYQAAIVFATSFVVAYVMVPASKKIAAVLGAIDYPSNRRTNTQPIPRCGGIALYLGLVAGVFAIFIGTRFFGWQLRDLYMLGNLNLAVLFAGVTLMFLVGLIDDITQLSAIPKFVGQIIAAAVVVYAGISIGTIRSPFSGEYLILGWLDYPLTTLYLVVFVNITNLIDGLDGLAAGLVAIVSTSLLYLVMMRGSYTLALVCIALVAVCLALLRFNFYPASIFMGDSGSHLLGLMVGIISVGGIVRTQSFIIMLVPLVIAGVPVLDTVSAIIRRLRGHQSIGQADMGHVHHRLLGSGMGQKRAVAILWACTAALAFAGCFISRVSGPARWGILIVLAFIVFAVIWRFKLFSPVLKHHYVNKGRKGKRKPWHAKQAEASGAESDGEDAGAGDADSSIDVSDAGAGRNDVGDGQGDDDAGVVGEAGGAHAARGAGETAKTTSGPGRRARHIKQPAVDSAPVLSKLDVTDSREEGGARG